ncbi:hypothetical protein DID88_000549 [Monilinia fructigena]|uniref:Uncharacterized protein n=1 Tax=Monilinia fructigena TaxID=38457 RepID=A0A395IKM3_9HELO|nr:hypothetical protein DID88_000549 [Monilinia fructigena]
MRNAGKWAVQKEWTERDLEEAKLSVFQSVDAPQSVSQEGMSRFVSGVSEEMVQERRERLLDVTKEQVQNAAQRYLVEALENNQGNIVFLGEQKQWVDGSWETKNLGLAQEQPEVMDEEDVKNAAFGS